MHNILNQNLFFVKEHIGIFKAANNYDIYHPQSGNMVMQCRETNLGWFSKMLRFTDYKRMTPFHIEVKTPDGQPVLRVKRGVSIFLSSVEVFDEQDQLIGIFKQKFFSIGGKFEVMDSEGRPLCMLKGHWLSWNFNFVKGNTVFANVSKKWDGIGKELFTSADNYMVEISNEVPENNALRTLILAAVLCIDMVLKE